VRKLPLANIMKRKYLLIFAIIILAVIAVKFIFPEKKSIEDEIISNWDKENTRDLYLDDEALINSKKLTQKHLQQFKEEFKNKRDSVDEFYVKVRLTENELAEHMWINILDLNKDQSIGLLDNEPLKIKSLKYLDTIRFDINDAEDLMLFKNDSLKLGSFLQSELEKQ
jgi:uncharacterized protein YegJ (DUF2314 family)